MKQLYSIIILSLLLGSSLSAKEFDGYIITVSGEQLTGRIGEIFFSEYLSTVIFVNDFGTRYELPAQVIGGFVFRKENGEVVEYRSKVIDRNFMFLKVICKGEGSFLFRSPEEKTVIIQRAGEVDLRSFRANEYYLQMRGNRPFRIRKLFFRIKMRKILRERAPRLADKIGRKGYRFQDLEQIITEYNEIYRATRYRL